MRKWEVGKQIYHLYDVLSAETIDLARGERNEDVQFSISLSRSGFCRFQA